MVLGGSRRGAVPVSFPWNSRVFCQPFPHLTREGLACGLTRCHGGLAPGRPLPGVTSCEGSQCWRLLPFFSFPEGRLISRNTEPLEAHKAEPRRSGIVSLLPPRSRVCFPSGSLPFRKALACEPRWVILAPLVPAFPPLFPLPFITEISVKFNALLGSSAGSRCWDARPPVPWTLRANAQGPVTTSGVVTRPEQPRNPPEASAGRSAVSMAWRPPAQHPGGSRLG